MNKEKKECKTCDYKNAIRKNRADWRCPHCGRKLFFEMYIAKGLLDNVKGVRV